MLLYHSRGNNILQLHLELFSKEAITKLLLFKMVLNSYLIKKKKKHSFSK